MSSTLLNRAFGLRDYRYVKTVYKGSKVDFHIEDCRPRCSSCGSEEVVHDGAYERTFRLPPIGLHLVFAVLPVPRLRCRTCCAKRQAEVRFAAPMKSYSRAFARLVVELLVHCSVGFVAKFLGIGWDTVKDIKLMNEQLDDLRRDIWRTAGRSDKKAIKGTLWILLRGRENLSSEPGRNGKLPETKLLEDALALNAPLAAAYYLKEDLRMLWLMSDLKSAKAWLRDWLKAAESSGINQMKKVAATIRSHYDGIMAYFTHNITSGPMEGNNNKVRTMMRQTYGLRDEEYLELRIKSLHEAKLRLVGWK